MAQNEASKINKKREDRFQEEKNDKIEIEIEINKQLEYKQLIW